MPPQDTRTLWNISVYGTAGAVIGAALMFWLIWWSTHRTPEVMDAEEERPPIIVSDGSLEFTAGRDRKNHARGNWDEDGSGTNKTWYHKHGQKDPATLAVNVVHGKGDEGSNCANANYYFQYSAFTIKYGLEGINSVEVSIAPHGGGANPKKYLTVRPSTGADPDFWSPFSMRVGDDAERLYSVTFKPTTGNPIVCDLTDPDAHLLIFQRR